MDWTVHQGKTPSNGTGPPFDHTKGTKDGEGFPMFSSFHNVKVESGLRHPRNLS